MAIMVNRDAPMSGLANLMAMKGRMGDTELVHMSKPEIRGLASLGQLTVNPSTGLPEAFKLGDALKVALPIAASFAAPYLAPALSITSPMGISALGAGLGGLASLATGQSLDKALFGAAASFGLGQILQGFNAEPTKGLSFDAAGNVTNIPASLQDEAISSSFSNFSGAPEIGPGVTSIGGEFTSLPTAKEPTFFKTLKQYSPFADKELSIAGQKYVGPQATEVGKLVGVEPTSPSFFQKAAIPALGIGAAGLLTPDAEPYEAPEKKPTTITPQEMYVAEEGAGAPSATTALEQALYGGAKRQGPRYGYRNLPSYVVAKSGGLISLAEGGMPLVNLISKLLKNKKEPPRDFDSDVRNLPTDLEEISPKDRKEAEDYAASVEKYRRNLALAGYPNAESEPPNPKVSGKPPAYYRDYESLPLDRWYGPRDELRQMSLEDLIKSKEDINFRTQYGSDLINRVLKEKQYEYGEDPNITGLSEGGLINLARGGMPEQGQYFEGRVKGCGDGMSDEVEFEVEGEDPDMAMLSRDEYVLPADVVAILGNGSSEAGADKLDMFVKQTRKKAFGTEKQQKEMKGDGGLSCLVA